MWPALGCQMGGLGWREWGWPGTGFWWCLETALACLLISHVWDTGSGKGGAAVPPHCGEPPTAPSSPLLFLQAHGAAGPAPPGAALFICGGLNPLWEDWRGKVGWGPQSQGGTGGSCLAGGPPAVAPRWRPRHGQGMVRLEVFVACCCPTTAIPVQNTGGVRGEGSWGDRDDHTNDFLLSHGRLVSLGPDLTINGILVPQGETQRFLRPSEKPWNELNEPERARATLCRCRHHSYHQSCNPGMWSFTEGKPDCHYERLVACGVLGLMVLVKLILSTNQHILNGRMPAFRTEKLGSYTGAREASMSRRSLENLGWKGWGRTRSMCSTSWSQRGSLHDWEGCQGAPVPEAGSGGEPAKQGLVRVGGHGGWQGSRAPRPSCEACSAPGFIAEKTFHLGSVCGAKYGFCGVVFHCKG